MSDGGLLQKAIDQQSGSEAVAVAAVIDADPAPEGSFIDTLKILFLGAILPSFIVMWFGVYIDVIPITILSPLILLATFAFVWWKLGVGLPASMSGSGLNTKKLFAVLATYILLVGTPFLLATIFIGDLSLDEVDFDDEGSVLTVKMRQNGGSGTYEADVTVYHAGAEVWSGVKSFTINKEDYKGDYGKFTLNTLDFYNGNGLPNEDSQYTLEVRVGDYSSTVELDSIVLSRTITSVDSYSAASMSTNSDDCGAKDSCVDGVALTAWAGIASQTGVPGALPYADYTLKATLSLEGNSVAIDYPEVTVVHGAATWNSMSGQYGSGMATVGDFGSMLSLAGSEDDVTLGTKVIPKEDWSESDFGCYHLTIEITQDSPWAGSQSASHTSYYLYEETGQDDDTAATDESWSEVSSC